jgi:hypothetical protein
MTARAWSRISGCSFLLLAGWLLLAMATAGGVGLDVRPVVGPWLLASLVVAPPLLVVRMLPLALIAAVLLGAASAVQWGRFILTDTYPLISVLLTLLAAAAAVAAAQGLRQWQSCGART